MNKEHFDIFMANPVQWRNETLSLWSFRLDLSHADLGYADLENAYLENADLSSANLIGTILE